MASLLTNLNDTLEVKDLGKDLLIELQARLKQLGYYDDAIDGIYGKNTGQAWAEFKADNWLGDTHLIGIESAKLLVSKTFQVVNINWNNPSKKISKYFTVRDVTKGDPRRVPKSSQVINNILKLASKLDEVREDWGKPIGVTSWYRPEPINRSVGGARNSQHITGSAADIYPIGGDIFAFQKWLDDRWDLSMGYGAKKGFVHLDLRPGRIRWNY
jgi:putative chitinase